jgi:hypothetical protein
VFPVRYELKFYIIFRRNSVFKGLIAFCNKIYDSIHGRILFKLLWRIVTDHYLPASFKYYVIL